MDNNHMIAIIEQKLHVNDGKIWSRYLETSQKEANLENPVGGFNANIYICQETYVIQTLLISAERFLL